MHVGGAGVVGGVGVGVSVQFGQVSQGVGDGVSGVGDGGTRLGAGVGTAVGIGVGGAGVGGAGVGSGVGRGVGRCVGGAGVGAGVGARVMPNGKPIQKFVLVPSAVSIPLDARFGYSLSFVRARRTDSQEPGAVIGKLSSAFQPRTVSLFSAKIRHQAYLGCCLCSITSNPMQLPATAHALTQASATSPQ